MNHYVIFEEKNNNLHTNKIIQRFAKTISTYMHKHLF